MAAPDIVMYEEEFNQIKGIISKLRVDANAKVVFLVDKNGQLIKSLTTAEAQALIDDGTISGGMIPKIESCIDVIAEGVEGVVIINGKVPHAVLLELFTEHGAGTLIERRRRRAARAAQ